MNQALAIASETVPIMLAVHDYTFAHSQNEPGHQAVDLGLATYGLGYNLLQLGEAVRQHDVRGAAGSIALGALNAASLYYHTIGEVAPLDPHESRIKRNSREALSLVATVVVIGAWTVGQHALNKRMAANS